jgi:hypothetical protein
MTTNISIWKETRSIKIYLESSLILLKDINTRGGAKQTELNIGRENSTSASQGKHPRSTWRGNG